VAEAPRRRASAESPIASVIQRMTALERRLPETDGVRRFNDLYLAVTRGVAADFEDGHFEDPDFLAALDVSFAARYFDAVDAVDRGGKPSAAWEPLFADRSKRRIAPIQFALAGMNAHINFDLCQALVATCEQRGVDLARDSAQHRDYLRVNAILARVEQQVKTRFRGELIDVADEALGRLDDVVAMWSVERARDAAWTHAEVLWKIREDSLLEEAYLDTLAHIVGLAGRGLLVPIL
jgi:hypothetical protein